MHNQDFSIHKKSSNNQNNNQPRPPPSPVTSKPEIIYNSVSWNPDAIDVTVNPNKGRKKNYNNNNQIAVTEKTREMIPPSQSTYTRSTAATSTMVINTESNDSNFESTYRSIEPGVKDAVLQSNDYKKWREMKNSFLFEPDNSSGTSSSTRTTEPTLRDSLDLLLAGINYRYEMTIIEKKLEIVKIFKRKNLQIIFYYLLLIL